MGRHCYCLCPTFRRPLCLLRSIYLFLCQTHSPRTMLIWDDSPIGDQLEACRRFYTPKIRDQHAEIVIVNSPRFASLPEKFNALAGLVPHDDSLLAIWEDDDVYLPWHLSQAVDTLNAAGAKMACYNKPLRVLSNYPGHVIEEDAQGRFHASIVFERRLFSAMGGWPITKRADFDQQFMGCLQRSGWDCTKTITAEPPSYLFRWQQAGPYHGQGLMRSPDDTTWYDRVGELPQMSKEDRAAFDFINRLGITLDVDRRILDTFLNSELLDSFTRRAGQLTASEYLEKQGKVWD